LGISFFLPWVQLFGGNVSGFDLQKLGDQQRLLWLIPIFCAITIPASKLCVDRDQKSVATEFYEARNTLLLTRTACRHPWCQFWTVTQAPAPLLNTWPEILGNFCL